ncbi:MAG: hypothetical protein JXA87_01585 [Thermoleophilia bacterium]|nr:hypothetical protein [Thermoleophilia bacterium]
MAVIYEEYPVYARPGETLAALRRAAEEASWIIEEDSAASFFCLERRRLRSTFFGRPAWRMSVIVEDLCGRSAARFVCWGQGERGGVMAHVRSLLSASGLSYPATRVPQSPGQVAVPAPLDPGLKPPAWVRWTRFGVYAPSILLAPLTAAGLVLGIHADWSYKYVFVLLFVLFGMAWLTSVLVADLAPRRALRIASRRGVRAWCLSSVFQTALSVGVAAAFEALLS